MARANGMSSDETRHPIAVCTGRRPGACGPITERDSKRECRAAACSASAGMAAWFEEGELEETSVPWQIDTQYQEYKVQSGDHP